ncbi:Flagellar biosynthetic protein FliP [Chlamydiales bacterium SCGC AG-110-M15]|nr:Flagellar biosynthetic protein FliP [Chlamydiales bacterium SCGC AG-110-M15]
MRNKLNPQQRKLLLILFLACFSLLLNNTPLHAQISPLSPEIPTALDSQINSPNPFEQLDFLNLHQQLRILGFLTLLSFIPFVLVMMTSFTRISIIFHFLRQALATQNVPSTQVIVGLSLILTGYVMHPVINDIQQNALGPYFNNELRNEPEVRLGLKGEDQILMERSWGPLRNFMLHHTREKDLLLFLEMGHIQLDSLDTDYFGNPVDNAEGPAYDLTTVPWYCIVPGFVLSELRTAFMMGFLLFIPFLIIDMIVASILMSMGMMMLPPVMISLPFKLLLFVVIDGWRLIIEQTVNGFFPAG